MTESGRRECWLNLSGNKIIVKNFLTGLENNHKLTKIASLALIAVIGFYIYGNSLEGKFIWDDGRIVENNIYIRNFNRPLDIFNGSIYINLGFGQGNVFYRPLQLFSYMLDYFFWRLNVKGYHFASIVLHVIVGICLYYFLNRIFSAPFIALAAGMLFMAHPLHTEAVAYISGRADVLAALFMLFCLIFYVGNKASAGNMVLLLMSYILALLSKESSLILPFIFLLYDFTFGNKIKNKRLILLSSVSIAYILARVTILKELLSAGFNNLAFTQRLLGFFEAIITYIKLFFFPFGLHMEYFKNSFHIFDGKVIAGILVSFLLLAYALKKRKSNPLFFFSVFWFFLTLLPVSNLFPLNAYMAEHWLYFPSIGLFLILAQGLSWLYNRYSKFLVFALLISLTAFYGSLTIKQNEYWKEPIAFYLRTLQYAPYSARLYNNLGNAYSDSGKYEAATAAYKKAIKLAPNFAASYNNLGVVYNDLSRHAEAMAMYQKAIELNKKNTEAYNNLGNTYFYLGRYADAIDAYKKAIELKQDYSEAYYNLGIVYSKLKKTDEAVGAYKQAIGIDPANLDAYYNLGLLYESLGNNDEAMKFYKKAMGS